MLDPILNLAEKFFVKFLEFAPIFKMVASAFISMMTVHEGAFSSMNKALFLDRDGVVNVDTHYVGRIEDFEFIPGIFDSLRAAQEQGYILIVVTNQAGIARGFYTEEDFLRLTEWMKDAFLKENILIRQVYYCPFHVDGVVEEFKGESPMRKPNPGMLLQAKQEHDIDCAQSIMIGDKESDIEAGKRAGVGCTVLVTQDKSLGTSADKVIASIAELPDCLGWIKG